MKIFFVKNEKRLSSWLTRLFTNSPWYHTGFVTDDMCTVYDMHLIRRKRYWAGLYDLENVEVVDCPVPISQEYLEHMLTADDNTYGYTDYLLFAVRPLVHFFGGYTVNRDGIICSEMVSDDMKKHGWFSPFYEVPSPGDLYRELVTKKNQVICG